MLTSRHNEKENTSLTITCVLLKRLSLSAVHITVLVVIAPIHPLPGFSSNIFTGMKFNNQGLLLQKKND